MFYSLCYHLSLFQNRPARQLYTNSYFAPSFIVNLSKRLHCRSLPLAMPAFMDAFNVCVSAIIITLRQKTFLPLCNQNRSEPHLGNSKQQGATNYWGKIKPFNLIAPKHIYVDSKSATKTFSRTSERKQINTDTSPHILRHSCKKYPNAKFILSVRVPSGPLSNSGWRGLSSESSSAAAAVTRRSI